MFLLLSLPDFATALLEKINVEMAIHATGSIIKSFLFNIPIYSNSTSSGTTNSIIQPVFEKAEWEAPGAVYK